MATKDILDELARANLAARQQAGQRVAKEAKGMPNAGAGYAQRARASMDPGVNPYMAQTGANMYGMDMDRANQLFQFNAEMERMKNAEAAPPGIGFGLGMLGSMGGGLLGQQMGKKKPLNQNAINAQAAANAAQGRM